MSPKHIDNITDPKRRAIAPYNFVELPEKVVEAQPLPEQNCYHDYSEHLINGETVKIKRHTGKIECTLTTESPLYTRCGLTPDNFSKYSEPPIHKTKEERERWEKEEKAKWEKERKEVLAPFFSYPNHKLPVILGSSIRGMLRTLVEIVSFSKIERVTDKKQFYRSLGDPALREIYQANFVENLTDVEVPPNSKADGYRSKVHAGFLRKRGNSYVIEECGYGRIDRNVINKVISNQPNIPTKPLYQGSSPSKTPSWTYQHQKIYVDIEPLEQDHFFIQQTNRNGKQRHPDLYLRFRKVHSASCNPGAGLQKGTLVITGDMQHKHLEFVFLDERLNEYPVDEEIIRRFQDDDQITKWQEKAYPKDKPSRGSREQDGYLRDGEPVFFLLNNDNTVRFFGRSQMFRLPYNNSPLDFVPLRLRFPNFQVLVMYFKMLFSNHQSVEYATLIALFPCFLDIADAIFGFIGDQKLNNLKAYASRVFITDGILKQNQKEKVQASLGKEPEPILLSSPKPTTFQHYLVQRKETQAHQKKLKHYASQPPTDTQEGETVIRGHKLYWHKKYKKQEIPENADSQTSLVKPIDPGIQFKFDIHFENLSNVELGTLLWVLSLSSDKSQQLETGKTDEKYCFSLGMGKPLGMGAVKIYYDLHLSARTARYSQLFNGNEWSQDEKDQDEVNQAEINCISEFEKYVLDRISENDYPTQHNREHLEHLKQIPRIEMLLAMLRCDKTPSVDQTRYMEIECNPSQKNCISKPKKDGKVNEYADRPVLPYPLDIIGLPDNRRLNNSPSSPSKSGGSGGASGSSGSTSKPILKGQNKGKPIKKSQQPQKQTKPKDNSGGSNSDVLARPPKPNS
ncbi:MAG: TIGR03986 family CRISPR-associated RAMP protein [Limnoraphis sp. WC205]|jgi:CRISPR-associated protein (TIGR03986 family)|nr:TIGR03986 family CRISPR-associated RAMP protein [Limnoraphis sp. WC205]